MSIFPYKIVKNKPTTPADTLLEEIKQILFPSLILRETLDKEGKVIKYHIDRSIDSNLEYALSDLRDGNNDAFVQSGLANCIEKLVDIRKKLDAYDTIDENAQYIIVENDEYGKKEIIPDIEGE